MSEYPCPAPRLPANPNRTPLKHTRYPAVVRRKEKWLSIALAIPCVDGVVVACDLQYTIGFTKIAGPKMFPAFRYYEPGSQNAVLVLATDNPESGKKLSGLIADALPAIFTMETFIESAEGALQDYLNKYYYPTPESERSALFCDLLLAARYGRDCRIFRANGPMLVEQKSYICIGEGLYLGNYLLSRLLPLTSTSVEVAGQIAAYVIEAASEYIGSVGKGCDLHILAQDGSHHSMLKPERETVQEHIDKAFNVFADLLACCDVGNTSMATHLRRLEKEIGELRAAQLARIERRRRMREYVETRSKQLSPQSPTTDPSD